VAKGLSHSSLRGAKWRGSLAVAEGSHLHKARLLHYVHNDGDEAKDALNIQDNPKLDTLWKLGRTRDDDSGLYIDWAHNGNRSENSR
jgi:hypothetical protein